MTEAFVLGHELAVRLLGNGLVDALRFLELGPQIKVRLGLVMGDGIGIVVNLVEEELVWVILRSEDIEALTSGLLAASLGILLDQLEELVHAFRLDVGLDDDADGLPGGHGGVARREGAGCVRCAGSSGAGQKGTGRAGCGGKDGGNEGGAGEHVSHAPNNLG